METYEATIEMMTETGKIQVSTYIFDARSQTEAEKIANDKRYNNQYCNVNILRMSEW